MQRLDELTGFKRIIGHQDVVSNLQNAIRAEQVSHAYLLGGEKGCGKRTLASVFAMTLQCREGGPEPCMNCPSCLKAIAGSHPDIIYITHEKPSGIGVDEVREQLVEDVQIRPYESRYKIYIVDEAEKMTPQAQNALLKTLEEPPEYAVIMLLAQNTEAMLPTIRSRCTILQLKPVRDNEIRDYLMTSMHVPDYQADILASFSQGNLGRAIHAAESSEFMDTVQSAVRLMRASKQMDTAEMIDAMKMMSVEKANAETYLQIFTMWFRDVLLFKATREVDNLVFREEINAIRERASLSSYEGLETILKAIETAETRLHANVNFDLVMELLFLTIREN